MDVREGYCQTEVGLIPKEWSVVKLKSVVIDMLQGINTAIVRPEYVTSGVTMLKANNIIDQHVKFDGADQISPRTYAGYSSRFRLKKNDFLFSNIGARLGTGSLLNVEGEFTFAWNVMRIVPDTNKIIPRFLSFLINSPRISLGIQNSQSGSGMGFVPKGTLQNISLPLPPTKAEQEAIAEALSDADALIESLEQLITKKRQIKQGVMQELLTGKRRLPGFSGKWNYLPLGEVANIVMGQSPNSANYNGEGNGLPLIQGNADILNRRTIRRVFTTQITKRGFEGDLLLSVRAPVGEVSRAEFDVCLGRGICAMQTANDFLFHALIAKEADWAKLSKGSTFDSVTSHDVKSFEIKLPHDVDEQNTIGHVLNEMDSDIQLVESKLQKARNIKQGMMQSLLTGKIRLI